MLKQNSNHKETGYVLGVVPYREHDAMVHFLGKESGLIRLVLPGYYKANSKQSRLGLEFSFVEYAFNPNKNKLNRIIGGELINAFMHVRFNSEWMIYVSIISEIILKNYDEHFHDWFYENLVKFVHPKSSLKDVITLLVEVILLSGHEPMLEGCVVCASTKINAFSIEQGGLVCNNHTGIKQSKPLLIGLISVFKNITQSVSDAELIDISSILFAYYEYHTDLKINSWNLYQQLQKK